MSRTSCDQGITTDAVLSAAYLLLPLIEEYFERFATKMCCFDDLRPYLGKLTPSEAVALDAVMLVASRSGDDPSLTFASGVSLTIAMSSSAD